MKRIYLDFASITPLDKRVFKKMKPYLTKFFANASSLYKEGRDTKAVLENARSEVAEVLQAKSNEIYFTGGGTESNNLAIVGIYHYQKFVLKKEKIHFITSTIEHSSVLEVMKQIEKEGVLITYLSPDQNGLIDFREVVNALTQDTVLISLMYGNNEIGTINDISRISKEVKQHVKNNKWGTVLIHTDASQGASYLNIRTDYLGVDLITIDASKVYGPKGTGILYKKTSANLSPVIYGGGHENGLRSGTENVASAVGIAAALKITETEKKKENVRQKKLQIEAFEYLQKNIPNLLINGDKERRLPNNINVCLPGIDTEFLVIKLDLLGVLCSSVTTCQNISEDSSSYVIKELDKARQNKEHYQCSKSSLRITLGRPTSRKELLQALSIITKTIQKNYATISKIHH